MAEASWKDQMTERWKSSSPHTLQEDLTLERLAIPRPITEVMKEDICYSINTAIEAPPVNLSTEEKKCQNTKLNCLNKEIFDIFYEAYTDFKNYINFILKNNFKPPDNLFAEKAEELQQKK